VRGMTFQEKLLTSQPPVEVSGRRMKRYYVTSGTAPITADIERAAIELLPRLAPDADSTPPAGFIVLHRGGDGATYLNAYTWVWDNALHMRGAVAAQPELDCPDDDPTHFIALDRPWIGCVWELSPIHHERNAWVRHILLPGAPDLDAYVADSMPSGRTR
jgi:hypothetical protein